jgi:hypothetical protein
MFEWFHRRQARQGELASGVDADLVRDNERRSKASLYLYCAAFLLLGFDALVKPLGVWRTVFLAATLLCCALGLLLGLWSRSERVFLDKPDPQAPPQLWK